MPDKNYCILIVDDDPAFHQQMRYAFRRGFEFEGAIGVSQLDKKLKEGAEFDLILLDLVLDTSEPEKKIGLELIDKLKTERPYWPIIVVTNDRQYGTVVNAMKKGADDFLQKDEYDEGEWEKKFRKVIEEYALKEENKKLKQQIAHIKAQHEYVMPPNYPLLGNSPQMEQIRRTLKVVADEPDLTVLITGETGVGKSIAARFLHFNSQKRRDKPFEEILISNIPKSLIESTLFGAKKGTFTDATKDIPGRLRLANKGIVFLDEIGDLYPETQSKLLQFLQTKTIYTIGSKQDISLDVQIVAATNKDLREEVSKGNFREDLYQRLKVFPIEIPPLRARREDILTLLLYFMGLPSKEELAEHLEPDVQTLLLEDYRWVGNARELQNTVKSMQLQKKVLGAEKVNLECLPDEIRNHKQIFPASEATANPGPAVHSSNTSAKNPMTKPAPQREGLSLDEQTDYNILLNIEEALKAKNGKKQDVADMLDFKSSDSLRYRIKTIYEKYPNLFDDFPRIRSSYRKLIDKLNENN